MRGLYYSRLSEALVIVRRTMNTLALASNNGRSDVEAVQHALSNAGNGRR
jgi:hypothetical protein